MRYKLIFKTVGELFDEKFYDSDTYIMTEESMQKLRGLEADDHFWRLLKCKQDYVIEGPTFEIAWRETPETGLTDKDKAWNRQRLRSFQELLPEGDVWLWDEYYRNALLGLLSDRNEYIRKQSGMVEETMKGYEEIARESADRSLAHHRKMCGDA